MHKPIPIEEEIEKFLDKYMVVSDDGAITMTWVSKDQRKEMLTELLNLIQTHTRRSNVEVLEEFRKYCYEAHAFEAWDTPQSNRQGWLDSKLRNFVEITELKSKEGEL